MNNNFIVDKDDSFIKAFEKKNEACDFAKTESLKNLKEEYCVYDNTTRDKLLVASYRQGTLGISTEPMIKRE